MPHRPALAAALLLATAGLAPPAPAVSAFFADRGRPIPREVATGAGIVRGRAFDAGRDIAWLRGAQPGDERAFRLFDDVLVHGSLLRRIESVPGSFTWYGRLSEPAGEFFLTVHRGVLVGVFSAPALGSFRIQVAGAGLHEIREVRAGDSCETFTPGADGSGAAPGAVLRDDGSVIDVLVAYTVSARIQMGGQDGIEALIIQAMDMTNVAYHNSGIAPRVRLVRMMEIVYTESGDLGTDLSRFRATSDGFMDNVHAERNTYGADLMALLVSGGDACGVAYLLTSLSPGFASSAFSVTVTGCVGNLTFAHELGHNLGCCHAPGDGGGCTAGGLFSYSVGHRWTGNSGTQWRSVMAYLPGIRVAHFSNPDTLYDGVASGVPIGQPGEAHNAATIDASASIAANWRQSICNDLAPTVTLVAPNGGEVVCAGTEQTASWTCSNEFFYNFVIELSTDGGTSWSIQGEGSGSGSSGDFDWIVPASPTTDGLLRVTVGNCAGTASDASDAVLELDAEAPIAVLQTFGGGETVCVAAVRDIEWTVASACPAVSWMIDYSTDSGGSWTAIDAGSGDGGGSYSWTVPNTPTSQARVRVTLSNPAGSYSATSVSDFTIVPVAAPAVELRTPNGGERWAAGSQQDIAWENTSCDASTTTIRYSTDGGGTWSVVSSSPGPGDSTYSWTIPGTPTEQALVHVFQSNAGGNDADTSDAPFAIVIPPLASILAPAGGEVWVAGTVHDIRWTNDGSTATTHTLEYSTDGGAGWNPILENVPGPGGSFEWTVPATTTASAKVRVTLENEAGADSHESPSVFNIAAVADFVDVTSGSLAAGGTSRGVAWSDYDADGDDDLLVTASLSGNLFLVNDGHGDFSNATTTPIANEGADGYSGAWGDFDNDGDRDVYLVIASSANVLLRNDGGAFTDVTAPPLDDGGIGRSGVWADADVDGDLDLYLVNLIGANKLFRNDGGGMFADATAGALGDEGIGSSAAWSDYDLDGDADLYLVNFGPNKLLRNDGDNSFVDVTSGPEGNPLGGLGASWGDYDNDGDPDLYVTNTSANLLLRNDDGSFADVTAGPLGDASWTNGSAWADADLDGDLDLYIANQGAPNKLLRNDGSSFADATPLVLADANDGQGVAWSDTNGDGTPDLYLANAGAPNKLFQNYSGGGNHWLHVDLRGTISNADGIGAKVRVVAGGVSRHHEVSAACGWISQSSRRAMFGLGPAASANSVEVRWPSGVVQVMTNIAADQVLAILESVPTDAVATVAPPAVYRLRAAAPNPFRVRTSIDFDLPAAGRASLRVYDVSGRLIRTLVDRTLEPGRHYVEWDGRDRAGGIVAAGTYFVRMESNEFRSTRRIVRLR